MLHEDDMGKLKGRIKHKILNKKIKMQNDKIEEKNNYANNVKLVHEI